MLSCHELKTQLQDIKDLKNKFEGAYDSFGSGAERDAKRKLLDEAGDLKDAIEEKMADLKSGLFPSTISAEYEHLNGRKEVISIDFEKKLEQYKNFYAEHMIPVPIDFEFKMAEIWEENKDQIKQGIEEVGFDDLLFVPAKINLEKLHQQMTEGYDPSNIGNFFW